MRLAGGMTDTEGRVEVCVSGPLWSSVCDDYWGALDAQVVCRQLGYSEGGSYLFKEMNYFIIGFLLSESLAFSTAYFGQGAGPILLDNVHCNGSESSLLDCNHLNQSNCAHSSDAGVRCQGQSHEVCNYIFINYIA